VVPFAVEPLDVRGRVARLGASLDHILAKHAYPTPVARLVGEACVLTVLLATSPKIEGRFQLQTRGDGAINMLVVDFDAPDRLRALARLNAEKLGPRARATDLIGTGHLAVTVESFLIAGEGRGRRRTRWHQRALRARRRTGVGRPRAAISICKTRRRPACPPDGKLSSHRHRLGCLFHRTRRISRDNVKACLDQ
jgi:hypothetical protein